MRMCPHCRTLVSDDNLIICPKCKANLNTYYKNNEVYYDKANDKNKKIPEDLNNIKKISKKKNNKKQLKTNDSLSQEKTVKAQKLWWIFPAAILYIVLIAVIIVVVFSSNRSEYANLNLNNISENNTATYCDSVFVALPDDNIDRKVNSIEYNERTDEYCISYKTLPQFFLNKKVNDVFVVEADEHSKEDAFKLGFSGKITEINQSNDDCFVKFIIPDFTQIFDSCSISTLENSNVTGVNFYPAEGYEVE